MPRLRYRLRSLLALPVIAALGLTLGITLSPATPFAGTRDVSLAFRVVAADSGKPIAGALVRIVHAFDDRPASAARTDGDGRARLDHGFQAWGQRRALRTTGEIQFDERWVEVHGDGYRPSLALLSRLTGRVRDLRGPAPPELTFVLVPGAAPETGLEGIAGEYQSLECRLKVLADGRFAFRRFPCQSEVDRSFGYAARRGDRLSLSAVEPAWWRGSGAAPMYHLARAGDRRYLVTPDEMADFRAAGSRDEARAAIFRLAFLHTDAPPPAASR